MQALGACPRRPDAAFPQVEHFTYPPVSIRGAISLGTFMGWIKRHQMYLMLVIVLCVGISLKISSLDTPHNEWDEQIYLTLVKNLHDNGRYSLQGTSILPNLSQSIYNKPLFHHPPLYIFLMTPFVYSFGDASSVIVSWLGHILVVLAVFLFSNYFIRDNIITFRMLIAVTIDPLLVFTSQKIWIDSLLAGLMAMAIVVFIIGTEYRRRVMWGLSGILLGLSILTKAPGILAGGIFFVIAIYVYFVKADKNVFKDLMFAAVAAVIITAPWFFEFYAYYGKLLPDWLKPDPWLLENNEFMRMVTDRPWYYFIKEFFLLNPLLGLTLIMQCILIKKTTFIEIVLWFWLLVVVAVLTLIAASGQSFQMRFIVPAVAPIYLLLGLLNTKIGNQMKPLSFWLFLISLILLAITSLLYTIHFESADIYSLVSLLSN
jgi:4-amino-4-deoxy-L-arabinose transferase-like glycosyltransferase